MDEYINDFKGQTICIKNISPHCLCYSCRKEKESTGEVETPQELKAEGED